MVDYILALLVQLSCYFGINYIEVIGDILADFYITPKYLSYFIIDNKLLYNIMLEALSKRFNFNKDNRHRQYVYYILNLIV